MVISSRGTLTKSDGSNISKQIKELRHFLQTKSNPSSNSSVRAEIINPFIESVKEVFDTMLQSDVSRDNIELKLNLPPNLDIVAIIGLSGYLRGIIALSFPVRTALAVVSRLYQKEHVTVDSTVIDTVAELVNIVAGRALSIFSNESGIAIDLSIPSVIRGSRFAMEMPSVAAWIELPFSCELGEFTIRVAVEKQFAN
ncbi:MAG: hypothetical protein C4527_02745 [Candidatus Omnitrophota bacterium]|jgi:chemotaxis protein CheX|nr:MAG: hypothetical protein C4527_02745 [Candidatus Omnitrophota bacterium]